MSYSLKDYQEYLYEVYRVGGIDSGLFMKLVEEIGEVAEVLNKRDGRKADGGEDIKNQLSEELVDVIHYAIAIAALNGIGISDAILQKYKKAAVKYNHKTNLVQFLQKK